MDHASRSTPTGKDTARQDAEVRVGFKMAGIGMQVASEVAAGALLGYLVDLWRGKGHVGVLIGSIIGITVGLWSLIRQTLKLNRQLDAIAAGRPRIKPLPPDNEPDDHWNDAKP